MRKYKAGSVVMLGFIKKLLLTPTKNTAIQAFRSLFVGGIAFVGDASVLALAERAGLHYLLAAAVGFTAGVAVNFLLSIKFVFFEKAKIGNKQIDRTAEALIYTAAALVGLGLTVLIMWILTDFIGLFYMLSKCAATIVVFAWNFFSRKLLLYRKS